MNKLLKKSGVVILHDWEREHYKPVLDKGKVIICFLKSFYNNKVKGSVSVYRKDLTNR